MWDAVRGTLGSFVFGPGASQGGLGCSGEHSEGFGGALGERVWQGGPVLQPMTPDPARPPGTEDPPYILKLPINRKADVMLFLVAF